jgi:cysteine-rich repeat protein
MAGAETCDDLNATSGDGCSDACAVETGYLCSGLPSTCVTDCGDGMLVGTETCDDGAAVSGDGCSSVCTVETGYACAGTPSACGATCGDGLTVGTETCDDGNVLAGDGCSMLCATETGYACTGLPSVCAPVCGDGVLVAPEACDDHNTANGDGCSSACTVETGFVCDATGCRPVCGDGLRVGLEACDDGNTAGADGCSAVCTVEPGFSCTGMPSVCTTTCGDGIVAGGETCDDANTAAGDGCSAACTPEAGYACNGSPSVCAGVCGDGIKQVNEVCDDGALNGICCVSSCGQVAAGCEVEFNDDITAANDFAALAIAGKVTGIIAPTTEKDVFKVTIPAGFQATITAETLEVAGGPTCVSNTLDTFLTLYNSAGTVLVTDEDTGAGFCSLLSRGGLEAGDYFVEVRRSTAGAATFPYALHLTVALTQCGNGLLETGEQCEDGNTVNGDGCSSQCKLEPRPETEPNNSCATASGPHVLPPNVLVGGSIAPAADADYYAFTLTSHADVRVETFDATGLGSCVTVDTKVQAFNSACVALGAADDESGINSCSLLDPTSATQAFMRHLAPGTYYVAVTPYSATAIFNYTMLLTTVALCGNGVREGSEQCDGTANCLADCTVVPVCGDGIKSGTEQCDDGNLVAGDLCSPTCTREVTAEVEPNNTCAAAAAPVTLGAAAMFSGSNNPLNDADYHAFTLTSYADVRVETFDSTGPGSCVTVDTKVQAFNSACVALGALDDDAGVGFCSLLDPTVAAQSFMRHLAPGTYYVAVTPFNATTPVFNYTVVLTTVATCGNGVREGSEQCDGGATCQPDCTLVPVCGDGIRSGTEQCDDGNLVSGDGCSAVCTVEATSEVEPNDTPAQADASLPPIPSSMRLLGGLSAATDKDIFKVNVATGGVVRFETFDLSLRDCVGMPAHTLTLLTSSGTTFKTDNGTGINTCSAIVAWLDPGTYYIQVTAALVVPAYTLAVVFGQNNGTETEPNDTQATANAEAGTEYFVCADHQLGTDVDIYSFPVPAGKSVRAEVVEVSPTAAFYETCESLGVDSYLTLYSPAFVSLVTNDDAGRGYCSLIDGTGAAAATAAAHNLAEGTYFLEVKRSSFATDTSPEALFNYCLAVTVR